MILCENYVYNDVTNFLNDSLTKLSFGCDDSIEFENNTEKQMKLKKLFDNLFRFCVIIR